jgi:polar amino acid transport system ATP-binding protein
MIEVCGLIKSGPLKVLDGVAQRTAGRSGGDHRSFAAASTLLRCINGLDVFDEGAVQVDQIRLCAELATEIGKSLRRRRTGMVFQQFNLFST